MGRYVVAKGDEAHAKEFLRDPLGAHSPSVRRVLDALRSEPRPGHRVLVCTRPWREWRLGLLPTRLGDPIVLTDTVFSSREEAEREVFRQRWREATSGGNEP